MFEEDIARPVGVAIHLDTTRGALERLGTELGVHVPTRTTRLARVFLGDRDHLLAPLQRLVCEKHAEAVVCPCKHRPSRLGPNRARATVVAAPLLGHLLRLKVGDEHRVEPAGEVEGDLLVRLVHKVADALPQAPALGGVHALQKAGGRPLRLQGEGLVELLAVSKDAAEPGIPLGVAAVHLWRVVVLKGAHAGVECDHRALRLRLGDRRSRHRDRDAEVEAAERVEGEPAVARDSVCACFPGKNGGRQRFHRPERAQVGVLLLLEQLDARPVPTAGVDVWLAVAARAAGVGAG